MAVKVANPSGKFWIPIPIPNATAAPSVYTLANSGITKAPKATPTASPSGILCQWWWSANWYFS